jgi:hypothetical protein
MAALLIVSSRWPCSVSESGMMSHWACDLLHYVKGGILSDN